jgi:hypothetical protein
MKRKRFIEKQLVTMNMKCQAVSHKVGSLLDSSTRDFMDARFGFDFCKEYTQMLN